MISYYRTMLVFYIPSEKIATPTSLMLMAVTSVVEMFWRGVMLRAITTDTWEYLAMCVPIVVICAPLASVIGSHMYRVVLALLVLILDTIALVSAFVIIPMSLTLGLVSGGIIVGGFVFFGLLAYVGHRLQLKESKAETVATSSVDKVDSGDVDETAGGVAEESESLCNATLV